jgi:hypothetical protein
MTDDRGVSEVRIPEQRAPVALEADVAVCGAGSAGLGAALAAARSGARVALIERWPFFGGNATAASLGSICGLYVADGDYLSGGIAREWAEALKARGHATGPLPYKESHVLIYSPWGYKRLADELVRAEPNITPLLHTLISGAVREGDDVGAIVLATKKGPMAVRAAVFVDATGDADVVFHAGCAWEMGPPGRLQYPSMHFYMQHVDVQKAFAAGLGTLNDRMAEAVRDGSYGLTREAGAAIPTMRPGEAVGAMTRVARADGCPPDGTDPFDLTYAEMTGRDIAEESARFLRDRMPGFEDAFIADTAVSIGIRETRHAVGDFMVRFDEALACVKHADGVAASAWPFEFHTEGARTRWENLPPGDWFEIPFRSLIARGAGNVLVAGRCVSAEHEALASSRVTGVCMAIGEAAGRAAAMCVAEGVHPRDLDAEKLRADLLATGVLRS